MPEFAFTARNLAGEDIRGSSPAGSKREAMIALGKQSLFPLSVRDLADAPHANKRGLFSRRVKAELLAANLTQLADLLENGVPEAEARNLVLLLMVLFENMQALNARSERRSVFRIPFAANPFLIVAIVAAQAIHIGAIYMPGLSGILDLQPIAMESWLPVAAVALTLIAVAEVYKFVRPATDETESSLSIKSR